MSVLHLIVGAFAIVALAAAAFALRVVERVVAHSRQLLVDLAELTEERRDLRAKLYLLTGLEEYAPEPSGLLAIHEATRAKLYTADAEQLASAFKREFAELKLQTVTTPEPSPEHLEVLRAALRKLGTAVTPLPLEAQRDAAPTPTAPEPLIFAQWFDVDGCGPTHFGLELATVPVISGSRLMISVRAADALTAEDIDVLPGHGEVLDGGFGLARDQVADLYRRLGAWLASTGAPT